MHHSIAYMGECPLCLIGEEELGADKVLLFEFTADAKPAVQSPTKPLAPQPGAKNESYLSIPSPL